MFFNHHDEEDGPGPSRPTVLSEQAVQLSGLCSGRFPLREGQVDERPAFRHSLFEPARAPGIVGLAFELRTASR